MQELGANFNVGEIPEDMKAEAEEWHEKLVEKAVEVDDAALEAYFEGEVGASHTLLFTAGPLITDPLMAGFLAAVLQCGRIFGLRRQGFVACMQVAREAGGTGC